MLTDHGIEAAVGDIGNQVQEDPEEEQCRAGGGGAAVMRGGTRPVARQVEEQEANLLEAVAETLESSMALSSCASTITQERNSEPLRYNRWRYWVWYVCYLVHSHEEHSLCAAGCDCCWVERDRSQVQHLRDSE